jgi:hypothetical protein
MPVDDLGSYGRKLDYNEITYIDSETPMTPPRPTGGVKQVYRDFDLNLQPTPHHNNEQSASKTNAEIEFGVTHVFDDDVKTKPEADVVNSSYDNKMTNLYSYTSISALSTTKLTIESLLSQKDLIKKFYQENCAKAVEVLRILG